MLRDQLVTWDVPVPADTLGDAADAEDFCDKLDPFRAFMTMSSGLNPSNANGICEESFSIGDFEECLCLRCRCGWLSNETSVGV